MGISRLLLLVVAIAALVAGAAAEEQVVVEAAAAAAEAGEIAAGAKEAATLRAELGQLRDKISALGADRKDNAEDQMEPSIFAPDLIKLLEESILTFRLFLKKDKKRSSTLMSVHGHTGSSIQQVQSSLDKKEVKVKELFKKKKGGKNKTWPTTMEEVQLLFALIDIKVVSRVLRMAKLSKEQLLWCEEKMSKLDLSDSKLRRDGSPILFPC